MDTRRSFLKKSALLSGSAALSGVLPPAIQKALSINPSKGSSYLDAEHIVVLMQENRSFDHAFGCLKGVRGFNDPRAIRLPNKNRVWLQTNSKGHTYAPFRLDLKNTKSTWMSSLPHSWENMVDARNEGKYDKWLEAKKSGNKEYSDMPLTLGYYNREDLPFYYALADAFTVCDHNFCSSLTGTTANRHFLWTGTIREKQDPDSKANVHNSDVTYNRWASWKTFPERLEENDISWRIYQNELSLPMGFEGEEEAWLANFTDNNMEWFSQYHVMFSEGFHAYLDQLLESLPKEIKELKDRIQNLSPTSGKYKEWQQEIEEREQTLAEAKENKIKYHPSKFKGLPKFEQNLHKKAFTTNQEDPFYHTIESFTYNDNGIDREMKLPKGDVFHQFRSDVEKGNLPEVSWLCAPKNFSDHPSAPWYGAWYISEVMDILTKNPEVWKKTIFIVTYDENDGYFDHVPPFVPPHPSGKNTGKISHNIHTGIDFANEKDEVERHNGDRTKARFGPVGLGFRVPLLVVSPWSRGGYVNSQVCDHTSILQLMENVMSYKKGKKVREDNISEWRRMICGDLSSAFRPYNGEKISLPESTNREEFVQTIHRAQFRDLPDGFVELSDREIAQINEDPNSSNRMPRQEKGIKNSNVLPYELYVNGGLSPDNEFFELRLKSGDKVFGDKSSGAPFTVYAPGSYLNEESGNFESVKVWNYAVDAGDELNDQFALNHFENGIYHLEVYGPNGFFRSFNGSTKDPNLAIECSYKVKSNSKKETTGMLELTFISGGNTQPFEISIEDQSYGQSSRVFQLGGHKGEREIVQINVDDNYGWYDFELKVTGSKEFCYRYAGKVETGKAQKTDPLMGGMA
ncbi:phosphocholine-specific phospholipase C [Membranihabitans maritimus]|uniref:phosphocholine-specific phospholipase C n=1 Tax=Membranihabitans maritimus TaxID=2904244 RepID=UPI001F01FA88|nr:phospholipase C, phosphocholine-specific [Membranihabitans maritimus]